MEMIDNRVLIKPIPEDDMTSGGIYLPNTRAHEPIEHGIVISVGPGKMLKDKTRAKPQLKEGDHVVMHYKHVGQEITVDREMFRIMRETDVLMVVEDEE